MWDGAVELLYQPLPLSCSKLDEHIQDPNWFYYLSISVVC